jgi:hypothetical protein
MSKPFGHFHQHRLSAKEIATMERTFANHGVLLHVDQGVLGGGNVIPHNNVLKWDSTDKDNVDIYYNDVNGNGFAQSRRGIFHYSIMAHKAPGHLLLCGKIGGQGATHLGLGDPGGRFNEQSGDFFVLFRACIDAFSEGQSKESRAIINTFVQELGHNLFGVIVPASISSQITRATGTGPR